MKEQIEKVLDEIRPFLRADGGDVELMGIEEGVVRVRLQGACYGCHMSLVTLKDGIERILKREIPEVKEVVAVE